jgi:predicted Holliday junction resolvase-like endonuclease
VQISTHFYSAVKGGCEMVKRALVLVLSVVIVLSLVLVAGCQKAAEMKDKAAEKATETKEKVTEKAEEAKKQADEEMKRAAERVGVVPKKKPAEGC